MTNPNPEETELEQSQIPAITLLQRMGWDYIRRDEAEAKRGGLSRVLLEDILLAQLAKINSFSYRGERRAFSDGTLKKALAHLRRFAFDRGMIAANQEVYEALTLGESFTEVVDGDSKDYSLQFIDWANPENNVFHVSAEFAVSRPGWIDSFRPDIVLFVNGIPLVVIECKARHVDVEAAIIDHQKKWTKAGIPELYKYCQVAIATNAKEAKYGTYDTKRDFWATWRLEKPEEAKLKGLIQQPLLDAQMKAVFGDAGLITLRNAGVVRRDFEAREAGVREVTEQDRLIYALFQPERLLKLVRNFIVFDGGVKKIARYQQFRAVGKAMERLRRPDQQGRRHGGVIYHTQGSGKSISMVMIAKAIAEDPTISDPRILLVTDRKNLDKQIVKTFKACGMDVKRATSGKGLGKMLDSKSSAVFTTVVNKFVGLVGTAGYCDEGKNIFILVDEAHRSQYNNFHHYMRRAFPNACLLGFTGTPLAKRTKEFYKDTFRQFGEMLDAYPLGDAVRDGSVVPLVYEGREIKYSVNESSIDSWFERKTQKLNDEQRKDLKRKYSRKDMLGRVESRLDLIARDVHEDFSKRFLKPKLTAGDSEFIQFKGQVVMPDRASAIRFKDMLDGWNRDLPAHEHVLSEVIITLGSAPEGDEEEESEAKQRISAFATKTLERFKGDEDAYNDYFVEEFTDEDTPHLLIVVSKLLTGFDAPRNSVLYLAKEMKEHTLLQAIARVNRVHKGKSEGVIVDYNCNLQGLDAALEFYRELGEPDEETAASMAEAIDRIDSHIEELAGVHAALLDVFKGASNPNDMASCAAYLADKDRRESFKERLSAFLHAFQIAQSSDRYIDKVELATHKAYEKDLRRFTKLRGDLAQQFNERVDFKEYEPQIQALLDKYVDAEDIKRLSAKAVNLHDRKAVELLLDSITGDAAKADRIHAEMTKRIEVDLKDQDPILHARFSKMIQDTLDRYRQQAISDKEYLEEMLANKDAFVEREQESVPSIVRDRTHAKPIYRLVCEWAKDLPGAHGEDDGDGNESDALAELAVAVDEVIEAKAIVDWAKKEQVINDMRSGLDDVFAEFFERFGLEVDYKMIDACVDRVIDSAKATRK